MEYLSLFIRFIGWVIEVVGSGWRWGWFSIGVVLGLDWGLFFGGVGFLRGRVYGVVLRWGSFFFRSRSYTLYL